MTKTRILIVEDHAVVARSIAQQLAISDYDPVAQTALGEQALILADQLRPDLVLMDIQLAGAMDGISAAQAIWKQFAIPVVFITALTDEATFARAKLAEPFGYLVKPFHSQELRRAIEMSLYKHRAEARLRNSEARYRKLFQDATEGIVLADAATGEILDCNQAFSQLSGYDRQELIGKPQTVLHPAEEGDPTVSGTFARHRDQEDGAVLAADLRTKSGELRRVEIKGMPLEIDGRKVMEGFFRDTTVESRYRHERELTLTLLRLLNDPNDTHELIRSLTGFLQQWTGCEAVGVRLRDGDDFPYFETRGFPPEFVQLENQLCLRDAQGQIVREAGGNPVLECMCGNVLCGRFNPALPFFTAKGTFWTNCTSELLATTSEADRQARTRNHCHGEGYQSVALIALRHAGETLGLLQFNDRARDRLTPEMIAFLERAADQIAMALAQRRGQAALRESEQRFRLAIEATGGGTYSYNFASEEGHFSPELKRLFGLAPGDPLPLDADKIPRFIHPEDRPGFLAAITAATDPRHSGLLRVEYRGFHADGSIRWLQIHGCTEFTGEGAERRASRTTGVVIDMTERKRVEEDLGLAHEELRRLLTHCPAMLYTLRLDGQTIIPVFLSDNIERLLGVPAAEAARYEWWLESLHPEDRERVLSTVTTELARDGYSMEYRIRHRDGSYRWIEDNNRVLRNAAGRPTEVMGVWLDITQRKKLQSELSLREGQLNSFFRGATAGLAMLDKDLRYLQINATLAEMNGVSVEQHIGKTVREVLPRFAPAVEPVFQQVLATGEPVLNFEASGETPSQPGVQRHWLLSYFPIAGADGRPDAVGAIVVETTERKRAEEALRSSEELYRSVVENVDAGITLIDLNHTLLAVNRAQSRMFGKTADELVGKKCFREFEKPRLGLSELPRR